MLLRKGKSLISLSKIHLGVRYHNWTFNTVGAEAPDYSLEKLLHYILNYYLQILFPNVPHAVVIYV